MDSALNSIVVTLIIFIISSEVGWLLGRSGIPYGVGKLVIHIILFLLITAGAVSALYKIQGTLHDNLYSTISLSVTGLTLLVNLITGVMLIYKPANTKLTSVHRHSKTIMGISIISSVIFLTANI